MLGAGSAIDVNEEVRRTFNAHGFDTLQRRGMALAGKCGMGVQKLEELTAWRVSRAFKLEVYRLVRDNPSANADLRLRSQLMEAAASVESNVAEGFERYSAGEFARFLSFSRASARESLVRLQDGVDRGHFSQNEITEAVELGNRSIALITALKNSLGPFIGKRR
jgi:four helix bundle protein